MTDQTNFKKQLTMSPLRMSKTNDMGLCLWGGNVMINTKLTQIKSNFNNFKFLVVTVKVN